MIFLCQIRPVVLFPFSNQNKKVMKKKYFPLCMACLFLLTMFSVRAQDSLTINFMNMNPHVGQNLYLTVVDTLNDMEVGRKSMMVDSADFMVKFGGLTTGHSYNLDFWADMNNNGQYDAPSTDHAWRIMIDSLQGDTTVTFTHNTDFTDIMWPADTNGGGGGSAKKSLTIAFKDMNPHLNQNFYLALKYKNGDELDRRDMIIDTANFDVKFDSVMVDSSYMVDFWADHNGNGKYDAPPTDHAWRIEVDNVKSDTVIPFVHNTDFTDINWKFRLTINFTGLDSLQSRALYVYLRDLGTGDFIDSLVYNPLMDTAFTAYMYSIVPDTTYNLDFYEDFNNNGSYDAPPTDRSWRIPLRNLQGDTTVNFTFSTNYTDIGLGGQDTTVSSVPGLQSRGFSTFPNPVRDQLYIRADKDKTISGIVRIFSPSGQLIRQQNVESAVGEISLNVSSLKPGLYILTVGQGNKTLQQRFIKE